MRARGRIDANQPELVDELRKLGASVQSLAAIGRGCPDILVGFRGENLAFEIKDPLQPPSKRQLTYEESLWHQNWNGQIDTVTTLEEILAVVGAFAK